MKGVFRDGRPATGKEMLVVFVIVPAVTCTTVLLFLGMML